MPRRFPIAQFPNPPLIAAMLAAAVARAGPGQIARGAELATRGALLVWAFEEMGAGANWFRRLLGTASAVHSLVVLRRLSGR